MIRENFVSILQFLALVLLGVVVAGCSSQSAALASQGESVSASAFSGPTFTLKTKILDGKMVYVGVGEEIDGVANPDLHMQTGDTVRLVLINGDGVPHDLAIPELNARTSAVARKDQTAETVITVLEAGTFAYYCTFSGHRQAGMEGKLIVGS